MRVLMLPSKPPACVPAELPELKGVDLAAPMDMIAAFHERMEKRGRQAPRRAALLPGLPCLAAPFTGRLPCPAAMQ